MDAPLSPLDWSLIHAFLVVAETGSLSGAARVLNASQPTIGRQIKAMEDQLGADLFHRHPRGLDLTDTGAALVTPARAMRDAVRQMELTAAGQQARLAGTVRITSSMATAINSLPAIIAGIRVAEPDIAIELVPSDDTQNLLWREADIAVRMFRPTQLDLITQHIGDIELGLFAAKSYVARRGLPRTPAEVMAHDVVGYDRNSAIVDGFRAAGFDVDRNWFKVRCDDNETYWQLVRAGNGIGFAQAHMGRRDPDMIQVDLPFPLPVLPVWLTAHQAMRHTPRIRRVWDLLAAGLRPLVS